MKTLRNILIASSILVCSTAFASASYYYPNQGYQYEVYPYQSNYVVSTYIPAVLTNCYYTRSYSYYGNCAGSNYTYTYQTYPYTYGYTNPYPVPTYTYAPQYVPQNQNYVYYNSYGNQSYYSPGYYTQSSNCHYSTSYSQTPCQYGN